MERFASLMHGRYEVVYSNTPTHCVFAGSSFPIEKIVVLAGNIGPTFGDDE